MSHPGNNGAPTVKPTNEDLLPCVRKSNSPTELAIDHVISKTFKHYDIPLQITDNIRSIFTAKLWRKVGLGRNSTFFPGKMESIPLGT